MLQARNVNALFAKMLTAFIIFFVSAFAPVICIIIGGILKTINFGNCYGVFIIRTTMVVFIIALQKIDISLLFHLRNGSYVFISRNTIREIELVDLKSRLELLVAESATTIRIDNVLKNIGLFDSTLILFVCFLS